MRKTIQDLLNDKNVKKLISQAILLGSLAYARRIPGKVREALLSRYTITVKIVNPDLVGWFSKWLSSQDYAKEDCRVLSAALYRGDEVTQSRGTDTEVPVAESSSYDRERILDRILLSPGQGSHSFVHNGKRYWLERGLQEGLGDLNIFLRPEQIVIRTIGNDRSKIEEVIGAVEDFINSKKKGKYSVSLLMGWGDWKELKISRPRSFESIILPNGRIDAIMADIREFLDKEAWYRERGIPYRRGYLFYGPPGNGKSSLIQAISGHFVLPLFMINVREENLTDARLASAINNIPNHSALLIEDADVAMPQKDSEGVTMSGLRNAIDGPAASEGRLLFMTTNNVDEIDKAIRRSGRIDVNVEFPNATTEQVGLLFNRFFPDASPESFVAGYVSESISMADIQEILLGSKLPAQAVQRMRVWPNI